MEELESIMVAGTAIIAAIGTLVARYQETDPTKSWFKRLMKTIDLTQIFDSTRTLKD